MSKKKSNRSSSGGRSFIDQAIAVIPKDLRRQVERYTADALKQADKNRVRSIAMPRIGAGYGGLDWDEVKMVIDSVFDNWAGMLYVYEEYQPET